MIGGGLAILQTLREQFGIEALQPARGALRQGVIFDLDARHAAAHLPGADALRATDMRDASVRQLQRRFEIDTAQAARVAAVADRLWSAVERDGVPGGAARAAAAAAAPPRRAAPGRAANGATSWPGPARCTRSA